MFVICGGSFGQAVEHDGGGIERPTPSRTHGRLDLLDHHLDVMTCQAVRRQGQEDEMCAVVVTR